jgi:hypothetical protein
MLSLLGLGLASVELHAQGAVLVANGGAGSYANLQAAIAAAADGEIHNCVMPLPCIRLTPDAPNSGVMEAAVPDEVLPLNIAWIEARILTSRQQCVLLDADLARIYGVETKRLVEQLKRNEGRFPEDFAWQLSRAETDNLRSQIATSSLIHGGRRYLPWVFTEHGAIMLANVLRSPSAVLASVEVVRAFVRLRGLVAQHRDLSRRLDELEQRYDLRFKAVFDAVRQLLEAPQRRRGRIGFEASPPGSEPPSPPRASG